MSLRSSSCLFHPSGENPFEKHTRHHSNYNPSPTREIVNKDFTLTPEKVTKRHEYSLPPERYTPDKYSFIEDKSFDIPTHDDKFSGEKTQQQTNKIKWSASGIVSLPSETSVLSNNETSIRASRQKQSVIPVKIKTTFANDSDITNMSQISKRLNQFRFGEPQPRSARKSSTSTTTNMPKAKPKPHLVSSNQKKKNNQTTVKTPFSSTFKNSILQDSTNVIKDSLPSLSKTKESPQKVLLPLESDDVVSSLESRLSQLLQETESVLSTSEDEMNFCSQSVHSSYSDSRNAPIENGYQTMPKIDRTTSLQPKYSPKPAQPKRHTIAQEYVTKPVQKPAFVEESNIPRKANIPLEDDILFQWRLRRKMESARQVASKMRQQAHAHSSFFEHENVLIPHREHDAETIIQPPPTTHVAMRDASISVVPVQSCETQTTKSLDEIDDTIVPNPDAVEYKSRKSSAESNISFHKVKIINAESEKTKQTDVMIPPASTPSVNTHCTDTTVWSDTEVTKIKSSSAVSPACVNSPTGNVVKNIVGMRLFETPSSVDTKRLELKSEASEHIHDDQTDNLQDSYSSLPTKENKELNVEVDVTDEEQSVKTSDEDVQPPIAAMHSDIINQILEEIENDMNDFPDDPILGNLREQRARFIKELALIEENLEKLSNGETEK